MSVLLPSSTLPAVIKRRTPWSSTADSGAGASIVIVGNPRPSTLVRLHRTVRGQPPKPATQNPAPALEVALALAPFHRRLGGLVVHPRGAALGDLLNGRLADDRLHRVGLAGDRAGAANVPDRPEPHREPLDRLVGARRGDRGDRHQQPTPPHHLALVGEVEARQWQVLARDVLPDVE